MPPEDAPAAEFGDRRLDQIRQEAAVEWEVIPEMPVRIKQLKVTTPVMDFYDFDEYERIGHSCKETRSTDSHHGPARR